MGERERWMTVVQARLDRIASTGDLGPALEDGALAEARQLERILTGDPGDLSARYLLGWLYWRRYQARPGGRDQQDLQAAVEMLAPCFVEGIGGLPEPLVPVLADHAAITATRLLEIAQGSGDQASLPAVIGIWSRIVAATSEDHPGRAGRLSNLGSALQARFGRTGAVTDLDATITCFREAMDAAPRDYPPRAAILSNLGSMLQARFQRTGAVTDLDAAVEVGQQAVRATSAADPNRAAILSNLGNALQARFERTGAAADLDAAVTCAREAVDTAAEDYPHRGAILSNLANVLRIRFGHTGAEADLDAAVEAGQQAVQATPVGHPDRAAYLSNLGTVLRTRFERTGAPADLDAAAETARQAVQATPATNPSRAAYLSNLGNVLQSRFQRTGTMADLDEAVTCAREAVDTAAEDYPSRATILSNLGNVLRIRFGRTGAVEDLERAVEAARQAVRAAPEGHPDRAMYLSNLGNVLLAQFERSGAPADLDTAVEAGQQAVQAIPPGRPVRAAYLSNLGAALQARFRRAGMLADVDLAITVFGEAVQATPDGHPDRPMYLSNLGITRRMRFERTGTTTDLDSAIACLRDAVLAAPGDHPDRATHLANLGGALRIRFASTGAMTDLDAAIAAGQQAVQATAADYPHRGLHLSNLGSALLSRFGRTGAMADLDAAVGAGRQAVQATRAGHPDHAMYLSNLGTMLSVRFERTGALADLDAALTCLREAVTATPADHPNRAQILSNLGNALKARFGRTEQIADLDAAVEAGQQAVQAASADHPDRGVILSNLGDALQTRFQHAGMAADRDAAVEMYQQAASVAGAPASARIAACRDGASLTAGADPGRAAGLLEAAVLLLPLVTPRFLERGDQQYALARFAGLAADAAALALSDPAMPELQRPLRALRLLEAARGVLLSQALSTRGDLSELRERHPELASRFTELRGLLDQPSPLSVTGLTGLPGDRAAGATQSTATIRRQADAELNRLLTQIRSQEGFSTFALPPSAGQLETQAAEGPVIVFNISAYRSDAILLTSSSITSRNLPGLDQATVIEQVTAFHQALETITSAGSPLDRVRAQQAIHQVLAWLWDTAAGPVLHALGHLGTPPPGKPWPRVWWVPTGLLSMLPIHAAGHHARAPDPGRRTVMDRVISSYTPTIGALAHARSAPAVVAPGAMSRSLIVAMPTTPDLPHEGRLTYVPAEAAMLRARLPHPTVLTENPTPGGTAADQLPTKTAVLEYLPGCTVAHFACHGRTDPADPSQSRLLLHDHRHDPFTVAALAPLVLDRAQLAYLSACSTALTRDTRLLDEAIHLASAFQLAGFRHVIGTLWEIDDAVAAKIADSFYAGLIAPDGTFDPQRAAHALHHAIRTQRDRCPATPYLWASHIHAGA